jgi:hypothetical protein
MSGQSWHEITVSQESRHGTTASPTKAGGFDEAADGRLLTQTVQKRLPIVIRRPGVEF